jgi:hypothetical protein
MIRDVRQQHVDLAYEECLHLRSAEKSFVDLYDCGRDIQDISDQKLVFTEVPEARLPS